MFQPDGDDGDLRAGRRRSCCRSRSSRRWSRSCIRGQVQEKENVLVRWAKRRLRADRCGWRCGCAGSSCRRRSSRSSASLLLFTRLGQEFVPTLDEQDIAMHAMRIPSTSLTQSTEMQFEVERTRQPHSRGGVRLLQDRHGRDGVRPDAAERLGHLHHPQAAGRVARPRRDRRATLRRAHRGGARASCPGNNYEFTQPIQMRFNELIAGVRSDVAVKVYGDDFEQMQRTAERDRRRAAQTSPARRT